MTRDKWLIIRHTDRRALRDRVIRFIKGPFRAAGGGGKDPGSFAAHRRTPKGMRKAWRLEAAAGK